MNLDGYPINLYLPLINFNTFDQWYGTLSKSMRKALLPACYVIFRFIFDQYMKILNEAKRDNIQTYIIDRNLTETFFGRAAIFTSMHKKILNKMWNRSPTEEYNCYLHTTNEIYKKTINLTPGMDKLLKMFMSSNSDKFLNYVFSTFIKIDLGTSLGSNMNTTLSQTKNESEHDIASWKAKQYAQPGQLPPPHPTPSKRDTKNAIDQQKKHTCTKLAVHFDNIRLFEYKIITSELTIVNTSKNGKYLYVGSGGYVYKCKCYGVDDKKYILKEPKKIACINERITSISVLDNEIVITGIDGSIILLVDDEIFATNRLNYTILSSNFIDKYTIFLGTLSGQGLVMNINNGNINLDRILVVPGPVTGIYSVEYSNTEYIAISHGNMVSILTKSLNIESFQPPLITQAFPNPITSLSIITTNYETGITNSPRIFLAVSMRNGIGMCIKYTRNYGGLTFNSGYLLEEEWVLEENVKDVKLFENDEGIGALVVAAKKAIILSMKSEIWGLSTVVPISRGMKGLVTEVGLICTSIPE